RVRDFIKRTAYEYIQAKALKMAAELGKCPTKITLRDTSSRWGSCSSDKHLSFCWKLALAPDYVLDYIIAHEVSHLCEMNHSPSFWATVGRLNVRQADAQIWLRKNGTELQAWE
ncbi:MAG: M48 family metallopeptidase, partial [Alphaproteobacteria bacterium]